MGFINPWTYKTLAAQPLATNDITVGSNGAQRSDISRNMFIYCNVGFPSASG